MGWGFNARVCRFLTFIICVWTSGAVWSGLAGYAADLKDLAKWNDWEESRDSLAMDPVQESTFTEDGLKLGIKHFPRPGAQPILMVHGLGTNDREWDLTYPNNVSFGRFLHALGYDVWIGNFRGFGTPGFESEKPRGTQGWTVDHYAAFDLPALVDRVHRATGKPLWLMGHSLAVYAIDGFLGGLEFDKDRKLRVDLGRIRRWNSQLRGLILFAGVHNLWWPKRLQDAVTDPVLNVSDYFRSNYELELLAGSKPLYYVLPIQGKFPLAKVRSIADLPFLNLFPFIGRQLSSLYGRVLGTFIGNPFMNIFYRTANMDNETLRYFAVDGVEDVPYRVIEQLGNTIQTGEALSYYHLKRPKDAYAYRDSLKWLKLPTLIVAGGHDRLTHSEMIYREGYLSIPSSDKTWIQVDKSGHLDLIIGKNLLQEIMIPVAKWLDARL